MFLCRVNFVGEQSFFFYVYVVNVGCFPDILHKAAEFLFIAPYMLINPNVEVSSLAGGWESVLNKNAKTLGVSFSNWLETIMFCP